MRKVDRRADARIDVLLHDRLGHDPVLPGDILCRDEPRRQSVRQIDPLILLRRFAVYLVIGILAIGHADRPAGILHGELRFTAAALAEHRGNRSRRCNGNQGAVPKAHILHAVDLILGEMGTHDVTVPNAVLILRVGAKLSGQFVAFNDRRPEHEAKDGICKRERFLGAVGQAQLHEHRSIPEHTKPNVAVVVGHLLLLFQRMPVEVLVYEPVEGTYTHLHSPDELSAVEVGVRRVRLLHKFRQVYRSQAART